METEYGTAKKKLTNRNMKALYSKLHIKPQLFCSGDLIISDVILHMCTSFYVRHIYVNFEIRKLTAHAPFFYAFLY